VKWRQWHVAKNSGPNLWAVQLIVECYTIILLVSTSHINAQMVQRSAVARCNYNTTITVSYLSDPTKMFATADLCDSWPLSGLWPSSSLTRENKQFNQSLQWHLTYQKKCHQLCWQHCNTITEKYSHLDFSSLMPYKTVKYVTYLLLRTGRNWQKHRGNAS